MAVSSAPGSGERAIVRMSGHRAVGVAATLFAPSSGPPVGALPGWSVVRGALRVAAFLAPVPARLYLMRAPRSYTREDVVEFHVVGSPPVVSGVLDEILSRDVRLARPGEFTERAYLSGRIDLSQAEAVLKLIHARSETEERLAVGELTGELSRRIGEITERLVEVLTRVELAIDFSEDDVPAADARTLVAELAGLRDDLDALRSSGAARTVYTELPRVAIVGRTNTGKSSLFN
ncbi:MAG TPA: tRNA uridine-5-carboxymethylaminomethyl(34) synthesis GTPase MnmE, partial [Planctomycetota bacterium]|nr:tRNA uridine-5-carboxymethylaminomethyl(34) synthesis GTPase MnmE [Planctomycetota bacterium]